MNIQLYGCYDADRRLSMDIYARQLHQGFTDGGHRCTLFTPQHQLERWPDSRFTMRYLRYMAYAKQLRPLQTKPEVDHIIDHGYAHLYGRLSAKVKAVTVHDLIPYLTWQGEIPSDAAPRKPRLNVFSLNYLDRFDKIITVSHSTANDLTEHWQLSKDRISVIPPVIADYFAPVDSAKVASFRQSLNVPVETKLVLLSGREHYKNLTTSLQVLANLIKAGEKLKVIRAGLPNLEFSRLTREFGLSDYVTSIYTQHHHELPLLYNAADCLLFPSWYEGFGMPVVEALACGTCVVTSNAASLPEVGGTLALNARPDDVDELSSHVVTCLNDVNHQQRVASNGEQWASQFRAKVVVPQLLDAYAA